MNLEDALDAIVQEFERDARKKTSKALTRHEKQITPELPLLYIDKIFAFNRDNEFETTAFEYFQEIFKNNKNAFKTFIGIDDMYLALADEYLKDTSKQHLQKYLRFKLDADVNI